MQQHIEGITESIKKSLDLNLWSKYFFIGIASFLVSLPILAVVFAIAMVVFGPYAGALQNDPMKIVSNLPAIAIQAVLLAAAYLLSLYFVSCYFKGVELKVAKESLENKDPSVMESLKVPFEKAIRYYLASVAIALSAIILFVLMMLPSIIKVLSEPMALLSLALEPSAESQGMLLLIVLNFIIAFGIIFLVLLMLSPFLWSMAPVFFFEKLGVVESVKRSLELGFKNYWKNIGYIAIYTVITALASTAFGYVQQAIMGIFAFAGFVPSAWDSAQLLSASLPQQATVLLLAMIIQIPFGLWSVSLLSLSITKLYKINSEERKENNEDKKAEIVEKPKTAARKAVPKKKQAKAKKK